LRSFFLSERLALLEILVPAAVLALRLLPGRSFGTAWRRGLLAVAPVGALLALVVFFTAFEYNRSWVSYYAFQGLSLWEFGSSRLTGYYVTALNNSAMLLKGLMIPIPFPAPYFTTEWLWTFPGFSKAFSYDALFGYPPDNSYRLMLEQLGTPEFNNPGGLLLPIADFGLVGAAIYWAVSGVLVGACFRLFRQGRLVGLLFYPIVFQALLELPRLLYLAAGRVFPTWLLLLVACLLLGQRGPQRAPVGKAVTP
jgi:hypothetical protein